MRKYIYFCLAIFALTLTACGPTKSIAYMDYKTQYIGSEMDGSVTVRSFGRGRTAIDSYNQAQKQAIYDILFVGLTKKDGSIIKPLLLEINSKEKYETYFDSFFKDNGIYKNFCSMKDKRYLSSNWKRTNAQSVCETTVVVYRSKLKAKLIEDGIIK